MGGGDGGASWKLKKAAKKIFGSFCQRQQTHVSPVSYSSCRRNNISSEIAVQGNSSTSAPQKENLCAICLDPLHYTSGSSLGARAIFTAQCSHAFHFACITSNVQHGSITCPICRARWTQLPRNLKTRRPLHNNTENRVLRILDDSIAMRYDDPIEPDHTSIQTRLSFSLLTYPSIDPCPSPSNGPYLRVKLEHQPATDFVLVAGPNGPHWSLMKRAMALAVSSLRPIDRLAIVACPSADARACTLRRMTSYGKRIALRIIDQLLYTAQADPTEGIEKGVKILGDRVEKNIQSCILHLMDTPLRSHDHWFDSEVVPVTIRRFNFGFGFDSCNGFIMHEFEGFLGRALGGRVEDVHMRIGDRKNMVVRIGEMRGGEERSIPLCVESGRVCVKYRYRDGECIRTGDVVVGIEEYDKGDGSDSRNDIVLGRRLNNCGENLDYYDPFMARWARYLHRL